MSPEASASPFPTQAVTEADVSAKIPKAGQHDRPPEKPGRERAADGSPLFDHFVGQGCAQSRDGGTWCPADRERATYYRVPFEPRVKQIVSTASPLVYVLSEQGQLFLMGYFDSDVNEDWSEHYASPHRVTGLPDIVSLSSARHFFALTKSGQVLTWDFGEVRDDAHFAVKLRQTKPTILFPSGVSRFEAHWGVCLEQRGKFWCSRDVDNLATSVGLVPHGLPSGTPDLIAVSSAPCFGATAGQLDCYAGWRNHSPGPERPAGHFVLKVRAKKISSSATSGLVLDEDGRLYRFAVPYLAVTPPHAAESPPLKHLAHIGTLADFGTGPCMITTDGVLGCRADGKWLREPQIPVKFTLTPPPHVRGPGG